MNYKLKVALIIVVIMIVGISFVVSISKVSSREIAKNETLMQCIADNSIYYTSLTCLECVTQEEKLGEYKYLFNIIDCTGSLHSPTIYNECQVMKNVNYPIWLVNNEKYIGTQSLSKLKRVTKC